MSALVHLVPSGPRAAPCFLGASVSPVNEGARAGEASQGPALCRSAVQARGRPCPRPRASAGRPESAAGQGGVFKC